MKIKVEFDLTPAEFRESMGWPDMSELHKNMLSEIKDKMQAGVEGYDAMSMMKPFLAQSATSMDGFQKAVSSMMEGAFSGTDSKK
jgi:hypothetical protein